VQIFTKRGRPGRTRVSLSTRYGASELRKRLALNQYGFDAAGNAVTRYDYQDELFRTGRQSETNLSLDGGNEQTTFYINGSWTDETGIMRSTSSTRRSGRVNLSQQVFPRFKLDLGANFVNTQNQFQVNGEGNGVLTAVLFAPTSFSFYPVNGVYPTPASIVNPLLALDRFRNPQDIDRFIGNAHGRFQLLDNLAFDYTLGYDGYTLEQSEFYPRGAFPAGVAATGLSANALRRSRILNQDGVATLTTAPNASLNLTTSVGFNFTNQQIRTTSAAATGLIPIGELVSAGSVPSATQSLVELLTLGFYAQQQVAIGEKLYLTGALRADASSTFGPNERWQLFPKVSASYVLSEDDWFRNSAGRLLSSARLRAAYGEAGNQPSVLNAYQRYDDYIPVSFDTRPGLINSVTLGNENLKPERQKEFEFGADLGFAQDRASAEITYYDKVVDGLLFFRPVASSTGYSRQFDDIGSVSNKGWELLLRTINFDAPRLRWESTVTYSRNRNRVERLDIQDFQSASGYPNRIREGEPVGVFYGAYAARNCQTGAFLLDSLGRLRPSNTLPDPATAAGLAARQALSGGSCNDSVNHVLGDPNPSWLGSLLNEFTIARSLRFRVLLDGSFGNDVMNLTKRIQDLGAASNSPDAERELLPIGDPRRLPTGYLARRLSIFEQYVEDGSFVKLREISASYTLDQPFVRRVIPSGLELTLTGRNLYVWTDYSGFDPEVNVFGQNPERVGSTAADRGFDFGSYPIPRTWSIAARFTY
jgi:outer membrane receptor protein involved in Fe transport